jgi:hypothetical protein
MRELDAEHRTIAAEVDYLPERRVRPVTSVLR